MRRIPFQSARLAPLLGTLLLLALPACDRLGVVGRLGAPLFDRPSLHLAGAGVSNLSLKGLTLAFKVRVRNPNRFRLTLRDWRCSLRLNGVEIPASPVAGPVEMGPREERIFALPVDVSFADLMEVVSRGIDRGALSYEFRSAIEAGTWLGSKAVPFEADGELSLPQALRRRLESGREETDRTSGGGDPAGVD